MDKEKAQKRLKECLKEHSVINEKLELLTNRAYELEMEISDLYATIRVWEKEEEGK